MVNTGLVSRPDVSYMVDLGPANWNISGADAVKSIPVIVRYTDTQAITLDVETGKAPEKICVRTDYGWCAEWEPIYKKYHLFSDWVNDKSVVWY